ncbi:CHAT domain-containing protein [filamentous cyanobacterium LEGE 11480]|uniref:CHAT domain-containing protein n=1 Tax=Romeriopsis navalis LEGE 11480 TaxID=2777977 RepID=A0A928VKP5_9CYAN|nr:CHAT domain-containing protein [Romeriopsis navalis]MBE9030336.1 CHAT domain-containing protein [Romeriopsis navalis LEGE 11480]
MPTGNAPSLNLAIDRLRAGSPNHFVIHVIESPYRAGYSVADSLWDESLNQLWQSWQEFFSTRTVPMVPYISAADEELPTSPMAEIPTANPMPQSVRLMQTLGINLWQWLFNGSIQTVLSQSLGIAMGQEQQLRLRLDIRDPDLIALPWEIMQDQPGKPAIAIGQQILFSRTTSDVETLPQLRKDQSLSILLVLGHDTLPAGALTEDLPESPSLDQTRLKLEQEASALSQLFTSSTRFGNMAPCQVDILVQPTPEELVQKLDTQRYNLFFYAGHGVPAPDGGLLFLRSDMAMNGTELAQVLTRAQVKLAVFNACWGAQPDQEGYQAIPRSSLAEVLLHHGVPAVLAMRDSIADQEALSFIQAFSQALAERLSIDQAVAVARQQLLTLFKFNQQAWTLPVLYMHPEFDGELIRPLPNHMTQIPMTATQVGRPTPKASMRSLTTSRSWVIRGGLMRVGISEENDLVLHGEPGVSRKHAEIICRNSFEGNEWSYFLRDFSRYGTWMASTGGWQKVHHQEVELLPGAQLKFGATQNGVLEFVVVEKE